MSCEVRHETRISTSAKCMVAAWLLAAASVSHASSNTLVGGGSTLPAIGYVGASTSNPVYLAGAGSLFGAFSAQTGNPGVSYCKTSDAVALAVLTGGGVQGACPSNGFGAATVGRSDLTQPNYVVLASPLNATDISNYHAGHGAAA